MADGETDRESAWADCNVLRRLACGEIHRLERHHMHPKTAATIPPFSQ